MAASGSDAHRALIGQVIDHYRHDGRVLAVAVFGSVSTGTWHDLSDIDLDVVIADGAEIIPGAEVSALFGVRAAIVLAGVDTADLVLDTLEEVSIRWHPLAATSPNICGSVHAVHGRLTAAEITAAGEANRARPEQERLLDALVRDAIGAWKMLHRGRGWEAAAGVERMRRSLLSLRGRRDNPRLDPAAVLAAVIAEAAAGFDLGPRRRALLERIGVPPPPSAGTAHAGVPAGRPKTRSALPCEPVRVKGEKGQP